MPDPFLPPSPPFPCFLLLRFPVPHPYRLAGSALFPCLLPEPALPHTLLSVSLSPAPALHILPPQPSVQRAVPPEGSLCLSFSYRSPIFSVSSLLQLPSLRHAFSVILTGSESLLFPFCAPSQPPRPILSRFCSQRSDTSVFPDW